MRPKPLRISKKEYEGFLTLQIKSRSDWWAVFSVDKDEQVWPFVCFGVTPKGRRQFVPLEEYPLLHDIAGNFVHNVDKRGGRFFIDRKGAYCIKGEDETDETRPANPEKFIEWQPDEDLPEERFRPLPGTATWLPPSSKPFSEYLKGIRR